MFRRGERGGSRRRVVALLVATSAVARLLLARQPHATPLQLRRIVHFSSPRLVCAAISQQRFRTPTLIRGRALGCRRPSSLAVVLVVGADPELEAVALVPASRGSVENRVIVH